MSPVAEARNEYTYAASGVKLKSVQKWNPNYSTAPVIGSAVNASALTMTKTTDYVGNIIFENNALKRILVDGGYIEAGVYYYYHTDHLGNNRVVVRQDGVNVQIRITTLTGNRWRITQMMPPNPTNSEARSMMPCTG